MLKVLGTPSRPTVWDATWARKPCGRDPGTKYQSRCRIPGRYHNRNWIKVLALRCPNLCRNWPTGYCIRRCDRPPPEYSTRHQLSWNWRRNRATRAAKRPNWRAKWLSGCVIWPFLWLGRWRPPMESCRRRRRRSWLTALTTPTCQMGMKDRPMVVIVNHLWIAGLALIPLWFCTWPISKVFIYFFWGGGLRSQRIFIWIPCYLKKNSNFMAKNPSTCPKIILKDHLQVLKRNPKRCRGTLSSKRILTFI